MSNTGQSGLASPRIRPALARTNPGRNTHSTMGQKQPACNYLGNCMATKHDLLLLLLAAPKLPLCGEIICTKEGLIGPCNVLSVGLLLLAVLETEDMVWNPSIELSMGRKGSKPTTVPSTEHRSLGRSQNCTSRIRPIPSLYTVLSLLLALLVVAIATETACARAYGLNPLPIPGTMHQKNW